MGETVRIVNLTQGTVVCEHGTIADNPVLRLRGLMGRRSLPEGQGLLMCPAPAIHTMFMRFPIDALFLDFDMKVLRVAENLRPWRMASQRGARAVLELPVGGAARGKVQVDDVLAVRAEDPALAPLESRLAAVTMRGAPRKGTATSDGGASASLRVMLLANDRRFRSVASTLLAQRGCEVSVCAASADLVERAAFDRAEVVVLDAGPSLTEAARTSAALQALSPPVGVVLVADEEAAGLSNLPVLSKWGPFEELFGAVMAAHPRPGPRGAIVEHR